MSSHKKERKYTIESYSPEWARRFEVEATALKTVFGPEVFSIEHIGSTAVPGLAGKPTIDILVTVKDISTADMFTPHIESFGYVPLGEYVTKGAHLFAKEKDGTRLVNLHIFPKGHPHVNEMLRMRDYFCSHRETVVEYSKLKSELQKRFPNDYAAYRKYKDEWMEQLKQTMESAKKRRFAFIDAQNTETTTNKMLGFVIDWKKLFLYLKEKWQCEKVFFYSGIEQGNETVSTEYEELSTLGYIVRAKPYFVYKNKGTVLKINCPKCGTEISHKVHGGAKWKSNCDVELAVDAKNCAGAEAEFLVFTGDGDFEFLIRDVVQTGTSVFIVSNARKIRVGSQYSISRFSTKLRTLLAEKRDKVKFIDIDDWKLRIKRDS